MGGTQDNGTWAYDGKAPFPKRWFESVAGDGGQSGTDAANANVRFHTYFDAQIDVNFNKTDSLGWDWIADSFFIPPGNSEARSFYIPIIPDPKVSGTWFAGLQHVLGTLNQGLVAGGRCTRCIEEGVWIAKIGFQREFEGFVIDLLSVLL